MNVKKTLRELLDVDVKDVKEKAPQFIKSTADEFPSQNRELQTHKNNFTKMIKEIKKIEYADNMDNRNTIDDLDNIIKAIKSMKKILSKRN